MIEDIDRDVFGRIQTDLLVVGDSIMTDRHHASNENYEDDEPQNQIGGIIPAFSRRTPDPAKPQSTVNGGLVTCLSIRLLLSTRAASSRTPSSFERRVFPTHRDGFARSKRASWLTRRVS